MFGLDICKLVYLAQPAHGSCPLLNSTVVNVAAEQIHLQVPPRIQQTIALQDQKELRPRAICFAMCPGQGATLLCSADTVDKLLLGWAAEASAAPQVWSLAPAQHCVM